MIIEINVTDKRPTVIGTPVIICGNSEYSIVFDFDDEWNDAGTKMARFVYTRAGKVEHKDVAVVDNTVKVPKLTNIREVSVGVYAGDLQTTTPARIPCDYSILCNSGEDATTGAEAPTLQDQIGDLSQLQTTNKTNLVAAINEAAKTGGSGEGGGVVTDEQIAAAVGDYFEENPLNVPTITVASFEDSNGRTGTEILLHTVNADGSFTDQQEKVYDGRDGAGAFVSVTKENGVATITAKDATGTSTVEVYDGSTEGMVPDSGWLPDMYLGTDANGNVVAKSAPVVNENDQVQSGDGSGGSGASETLLVDFTVAEDVKQIDIPITADMVTAIKSARELIYEMEFKLPTEDDGTKLGSLKFGTAASWGMVMTFINDNVQLTSPAGPLFCLPTNAASYKAPCTVIGRAVLGAKTVVTTNGVWVKNSSNEWMTRVYSDAYTAPTTAHTFRLVGSHNIGANSTIKIYARK